jgi:uncharacterized NAD(P)/FAD-binding protein YdhS/predicted metal-dependent enzyme (double-stranded beta helix superfamily)
MVTKDGKSAVQVSNCDGGLDPPGGNVANSPNRVTARHGSVTNSVEFVDARGGNVASAADFMTPKSRRIPQLVALVREFEALGARITDSAMREILLRSNLRIDHLKSFVGPTPASFVAPTPTSLVMPAPASFVAPTSASFVEPTPTSFVEPTPTSLVAPTRASAVESAPTWSIEPTRAGYSRQRVARTEFFEILVAAWLPGQSTGAHDHAGSASAFKILSGTAQETLYARAPDSMVDPIGTRDWHEGEVGLDAGDVIHAVRNACAAGKLLVSVHVYALPLRQLRRFTVRPEGWPAAAAVPRRRAAGALTVVIVGGGFSGAMVAAHLLRRTVQSSRSLHVVVIDRQSSIAEGSAYRTVDASHLLNVRACNMSAWSDRPDDFLQWARRRDPAVGPDSFLPRAIYGEYLRETLCQALAQTGFQSSFEIRADEVDTIERCSAGGWRVHCAQRAAIEADVVVLATGHRPVVDPLKGCWSGARTRYIEDPWGSGALSSIEPDETVCLLGTGLTAVDTLLSLLRQTRTGRIMALSRRGVMPAVHAPIALPAIDPREWLERLLHRGDPLTARAVGAAIRRAVVEAERTGQDWRQIIDGLRPHNSRIARALPRAEMSRFLRHARPFWEAMRHRMAPAVAERVTVAAAAGLFSTAAARVLSARGALDRVTMTIRRRGEPVLETVHYDWIVNCTGPGCGRGVGVPAVIEGLIKAGHVEEDALGLGVRTTPEGRAVARGRVVDDLLVVGSLRKPDQWESTAVPELRVQAARAADLMMQRPLTVAAPRRVDNAFKVNHYHTHMEQPDVTS